MADKSKKITPPNVKQTADKVTKAAGDVFGKLKTHFEPKKVDEWQKKWLATPEKRKKYEKLSDAPQVVGEEITAMTNDIIDFIQGQEGGKSSLFKKIKAAGSSFFKNPAKYMQEQAAKGKEMAKKASETAMKGMEKAKEGAEKASQAAQKGVEKAKAGAEKASQTAKKGMEKAKDVTKKGKK